MPGIVDLPCELILIIFDYVSSRDLWQNVRLTCRFLAIIIADHRYWKGKLQKEHAVELPQCQLCGSATFLSHICAKIEEEKERWEDGSLQRLIRATGHDATVDALALMRSAAHKRLCISGARDRALVVWDVNLVAKQVDRGSWKLREVPDAHRGWIWNVCKAGMDTFLSCAWDHFVKQWQIVDGHVHEICGVQMPSAVLCVINDGGIAMCSTFGRKVTVLDARNSLQKITDMVYHRGAVFDLAQLPGSEYVYSCGQDRLIACVDKRMWKVVNQLELEVYSQTLSIRQGQLLCGANDGKMLSIDPDTLGIVSEMLAESEGSIRQVKLNIGSQMCLTKKRRLKVFTPGLRPKLFSESTDFDAEPCRFDYYGDDLAVACGNGSIFFWTH